MFCCFFSLYLAVKFHRDSRESICCFHFHPNCILPPPFPAAGGHFFMSVESFYETLVKRCFSRCSALPLSVQAVEECQACGWPWTPVVLAQGTTTNLRGCSHASDHRIQRHQCVNDRPPTLLLFMGRPGNPLCFTVGSVVRGWVITVDQFFFISFVLFT